MNATTKPEQNTSEMTATSHDGESGHGACLCVVAAMHRHNHRRQHERLVALGLHNSTRLCTYMRFVTSKLTHFNSFLSIVASFITSCACVRACLSYCVVLHGRNWETVHAHSKPNQTPK
mmetsp:Transcript_14145/g.40307  ORF Transcript_14145/g.40307 Transcript_14145/m.40307 type:complete len:119 (-) Transcript_14145:127-483(-)